jgi:hypothetical protein
MAKRLRDQDFKIPKRISDAEWEALCETSRIAVKYRHQLRMRLNNVVDSLVGWMSEERNLPERKSDLAQVNDMLSHVDKAGAVISRLGPAGHLAFKAISPFLAPMLAAQWMNESFPDNDSTPKRSVPEEFSGLRCPPRQTHRTSEYFIEEDSLEARFEFVRQNPAQTLKAALEQIDVGLREILCALDLQPRSRGGQKPLVYRHYAIINLIEIWDEMGRVPSSGPDSDCTSFCVEVIYAMGWPTKGLSAAMPDAIKHWRHLSGKN